MRNRIDLSKIEIDPQTAFERLQEEYLKGAARFYDLKIKYEALKAAKDKAVKDKDE